MSGHSTTDGVPSNLLMQSENQDQLTYRKISNNWSISHSPRNKGRWRHISANTQPTPHISKGIPYVGAFNNTSGGRYQRVTTSCVNARSGKRQRRARPKSANFKWPTIIDKYF